jgi:hypothetical protein
MQELFYYFMYNTVLNSGLNTTYILNSKKLLKIITKSQLNVT